MPEPTDSESIIKSTLAMGREEREAYIASILPESEKSGAFLDAVDALSGYLSLLRTGGGVEAHRRLGLGDTGETSPAPISIDHYDLGQVLGSGGFADVYAARQLKPIEREVAIKILRSGHGDAEVMSRFRGEQHALAQLEHPNIAQVFDAGKTADGRLFFVMEKIDGLAITRYCQRHQLSLRSRLALFQDVCEAVEFAHSRSIIHRDLKPSNVMVTDQSGKPQVKVIDFGIAKALDQQTRAAGPLTRQGEFLGTPQCMSPEQLGLGSGNVDRRSDVYALGVLLYELLCDLSPFRGATTEATMISVWRYANGETEVARPSRRALEAAAGTRGFARQLRGDLDWITSKAMAVDSSQRYQSVMALSDDIERLLGHQPVHAGPPALHYRAGKFMRRNWLVLAAAGLTLGTLVGGLIQTTVERNRTAQALAALTEVTHFQSQMLSSYDAYSFGADLRRTLEQEQIGPRVNYTDIARQVLDSAVISKASAALGTGFSSDPEIESQLRESLGAVYLNLGLRKKAITQFELARAKHQEARSDEPQRRIALTGQLANALDQDGQYEAALYLGEQRARDAAEHFDPNDPVYLETLSDLASIHISFGQFEQAEALQAQAADGFAQIYGDEDARVLSERHLYATILHHQGRLDESLALREAILKSRKKVLGRLDDDLIVSYVGLGSLHHHLGNLARSEEHLREAFDRRRESLGDGHPRTLSLYNRLAAVLLDQDRIDDAQDFIEQGLSHFEATSDPDEARHLLLKARLASIHSARKQHAAAATVLESVYNDSVAFQGEDNPESVVYLASLASAQTEAGRLEIAESLFNKAQSHYLRIWGDAHPRYGILLSGIAELESRRGRHKLALDRVRQAELIYQNSFGEVDHILVADLLLQQARLLAAADELEMSGDAARRAAGMYERMGLSRKARTAETLVPVTQTSASR